MNKLKTGDIAHRIGLIITTELITKVGFPPDESDGRSKFWNEDKYPAICDALGTYIMGRKTVTSMAPPKVKARATPVDDDEL